MEVSALASKLAPYQVGSRSEMPSVIISCLKMTKRTTPNTGNGIRHVLSFLLDFRSVGRFCICLACNIWVILAGLGKHFLIGKAARSRPNSEINQFHHK